jgi:hypothetical protein
LGNLFEIAHLKERDRYWYGRITLRRTLENSAVRMKSGRI